MLLGWKKCSSQSVQNLFKQASDRKQNYNSRVLWFRKKTEKKSGKRHAELQSDEQQIENMGDISEKKQALSNLRKYTTTDDTEILTTKS